MGERVKARPSDKVRVDADAETRKLVVASGASVYYGGAGVSSASNDGTLTSGQSVTLTATKFFLTSGSNGNHSVLQVSELAADAVDLGGLDARLDNAEASILSVERSGVVLVGTGVAATDGAALQAALTANAYLKPVLLSGDFAYAPGAVVMPDGGVVRFLPGAKITATSRVAGRNGLITVPTGTTDWEIDGGEFVGLYSGSGALTNPANSGIWIEGATNGRVSGRTVCHHFDAAGLTISCLDDDVADIDIDNYTGHSNGIDGLEINMGDGAGTGGTAERITIGRFRAWNNRYFGLEATGDGVAVKHLIVGDAITYDNDVDGIRLAPISGATIEDVALGSVVSYSNDAAGVNLSRVTRASLGTIVASSNATAGVTLNTVLDAAVDAIVASSNSKRGLEINTASKRIVAGSVVARSNGATAASGTAAVEVLNASGACEEVVLEGLVVSGNTREGVRATGLLYGRIAGLIKQNLEAGLTLSSAERVHCDVTAYNNTTKGVVLRDDTKWCTVTADLGDTGSAVQTTGWAINASTCEDNTIIERQNNCATPSSNSGTRTVKQLTSILSRIQTGSGSPEGAGFYGSPGDIYLRSDAGVGYIYVKRSGAGTNTGWVTSATA